MVTFRALGDHICVSNASTPASRGRKQRRSTDATRGQRNQAIVFARISGSTWAQIAEQFGLSESQVRQVFRDHREAATHTSDFVAHLGATLAESVAAHRAAAAEMRSLLKQLDPAVRPGRVRVAAGDGQHVPA